MHRKFWIGTLLTAFLISLGWGFNEYRLAGEYRNVLENNNRRALADFAGQLDQMETDMAKGNVANDPHQQVYYLTHVSSTSDTALTDYSQIPAQQVGLSYIGEFLTQSGDFTRTLSQRIAGGEKISPAEQKILNDMHERLIPMNQKVQDLMNKMDTRNLGWIDPSPSIWRRAGIGGPKIAKAAADSTEAPVKSVRSGLDQLDASLQKLPPFSYVGEYSNQVVEKPLGLPAGQASQNQAFITAQDFLKKVGYPNAVPKFSGDSRGAMGGYLWKYKEAELEISHQGGKVTFYSDQRSLNPRTLSVKEAEDKAKAILKSLGWNLVLTSSENFGSYVRFDAVAEKDGVRIYPDKVRLMIAMDNGQLIGFDATPYYEFHRNRTFSAKITSDQAKSKLRPNFKVMENNRAIVTKVGNQEVNCYEFRGLYQGEEYLIYFNAATGSEEKIQRIIKTPRGESFQ